MLAMPRSGAFAEINARAAQRDNSATQYHVGDRVSLLEAVLDRHASRIAEERQQMMADLGPDATTDDIVRALVGPMARCLDDPSGRRYLIIQASLLTHPDREIWPEHVARPWTRPGIDELAKEVRERQHQPPGDETVADFTREMATLLVFHGLASRALRTGPDADNSVFVEVLVKSLVALIEADPPGSLS